MTEEWRDIRGYEGLYQVSNHGNIRKLRFINNITNKEKIFPITPQVINSGYEKVVLYKNGKYKNRTVHRIVAETFLEKDSEKKFVNHKDGDKRNNCVENLEWCTKSENMKHAFKTGLAKAHSKGKYGANNAKAIPVEMLDKNTGEILMTFGSLIDAAKYIGIDKSCHICSCCKGKLKSAYGYSWRYTT